jgi:hypothetical protein
MSRRLSLKTEHLTALTTDELGSVAGGQEIPPSLPCMTGVYPTINYPCTRLVGDLLTGTTSTS